VSGRQAAFFDLDKTVIAKASMAAFGHPLYRRGLISKGDVIKGLYHNLIYVHFGAGRRRLERVRSSVLELAKGWDQETVKDIIERALAETVDPILYREALEEIEAHQRQGRLVYIVSASPEEVVKPLGRYLGVDGVIATRAEVDESGRYTGRVAFYAYGQEKATAIAQLAESVGLDLSASYAYSDSVSDLPMLELVGHPVAVNPDRHLEKVARERGWPIVRFREPVSLAEKSAKGIPVGVIATGMSAVTVAALAGVAWYLRLQRRRAVSSAHPATLAA
jgi:HAD superfamily hydrolase (TIGR01490 family)